MFSKDLLGPLLFFWILGLSQSIKSKTPCEDLFYSIFQYDRVVLCKGFATYQKCRKNASIQEKWPKTLAQIRSFCTDPFYKLPTNSSEIKEKSRCRADCRASRDIKYTSDEATDIADICSYWTYYLECLAACPNGELRVQETLLAIPHGYVIIQSFCKKWNISWRPLPLSNESLVFDKYFQPKSKSPGVEVFDHVLDEPPALCFGLCKYFLQDDSLFPESNWTDNCIRRHKYDKCVSSCPGNLYVNLGLESVTLDYLRGSCYKFPKTITNCVSRCPPASKINLNRNCLCRSWNKFLDCAERCSEDDPRFLDNAMKQLSGEPNQSVLQPSLLYGDGCRKNLPIMTPGMQCPRKIPSCQRENN